MFGKFTGLRFALALLAAAVFGGPALAASAELELAAWVSEHTDLPPAQVALAGAENLYSVEPLGPPAATGEVIARVRTEAVDPDWRATHRFQSLEAHVLFDCAGKRVRLIRSASYPQANLGGEPKIDDVGGAWFAPKPNEPAATLLAAACDRDFAWPLRTAPATQPQAPALDAPPLVKAELVAPEPRVAPGGAPKILLAASPASGRAVAPRKVEVSAKAADQPAAAAPQPGARWRLAGLATAPKAAAARVQRLADAGQGFVTRRASSVGRWFAAKSQPPAVVQQASL